MPAFSAVTVPLSNPVAGQPLVVSATVSGGTATMTFPAGTTVTPGTSILIKTITLPTLVFAQSRGRSAQDSSGTSSGPNPGLYVQVLDGQINVNNGSGAQNFTTGQFGFTPGVQQPPVVLPNNPGLQFTPPPTFAAPVDAAGHVGPAYVANTSANGDIQVPLVLNKNQPLMVVLGPQSMFPSTTTFVDPSAATASTGAAATNLSLPAIDGGFTAGVALPAAANSVGISASFSLNAPAGVAAIASSTRVRQSIGGTFSTAAYLTLTAASAVSFASTPGFTFTYPTGTAFNAGESLYIAFFDPAHAANGWTAFAGPGVISGQTVTFASANIPTSFAATASYQFALISTTQTLAVPTPAPTSAPTVTPTAAPTATPTAAPTPSPTASSTASPTQVPVAPPTEILPP